MHIITWTNKTDSFGHIFDESDSKFWYTQTFGSPYFWDAVDQLRKLHALEAAGKISDVKHEYKVYED